MKKFLILWGLIFLFFPQTVTSAQKNFPEPKQGINEVLERAFLYQRTPFWLMALRKSKKKNKNKKVLEQSHKKISSSEDLKSKETLEPAIPNPVPAIPKDNKEEILNRDKRKIEDDLDFWENHVPEEYKKYYEDTPQERQPSPQKKNSDSE